MKLKLINEWKKVDESDLSYICSEVKDAITYKSVLLLEGQMGVGKTAFAKSFIGADVQSPTYSLINEYPDILHADFDRLVDDSEIIELDLQEYLSGVGYFLIEWGEKFLTRLEKEVPDDYSFFRVKLEKNTSNDQLRSIQLHELQDI